MTAPLKLRVRPGIGPGARSTTVFEIEEYVAGELHPGRVNVAEIALRTPEEADALAKVAAEAQRMFASIRAGGR